MALKIDYMVKETGTNLRRNVLMTSAAVLTVTISLALVGGALLLKQGVANATVQWRGGVELSIFMRPDATPNQLQAIEAELGQVGQVESYRFVDKQEAFEEFQTMFANQPDVVDALTVEDLPPSFRVVPTEAELVDVIGEQFEARSGVQEVVYAKERVETLLSVSRIAQVAIVSVATVFLLSAVLLILNTIRMAIYARRREVAVMKLVGATNWFIRVPFMLEGLVQGLIGAGLAGLLVLVTRQVVQALAGEYPILDSLLVTSEQAYGTGLLVLAVGMAVGTMSSVVAVRRFLEV